MLRDFKLVRRNSGKHPNLDEIENIPVDPNTVEEQEVGLKNCKVVKTPSKSGRIRYSDGGALLKTPDKRGVSTGNRFGWAQRNESSSNAATELGIDLNHYRNTPRPSKGVGRSNSDCNSTETTPSKSVSKPSNQALCLTGGSRPPLTGARMANFAALSRGIPSSGSSLTVVNTVEVPHFAMKEDPSFWMDHNVQVLIRVRPLNNMEKSTQGYNRCLKQESSQCITWIGNPETRFTFDHVACESVDQETLFRMVGLPMVENCLSGYNSCMFAYGQTGSGKTYTMLGDIDDLGIKLSPNRGMTPRIFEFLFARIRAEEESRRDERLTYNCKCSFLEIYNEQITDLLDPSSTNLLIREDIKTGVYVENLSELEVQTVGDILKLLSQGSSNRKVAATNMNRESSRSHSVFTCVIESRWEKDSTSNLRFARLNLVDLAGSERQKSSGAEGERLKEAANINKSLSTLGHVIMVLVDVAHAKTRHVPYRDSRLTFLLQDSLGGNSKTMIIANVSPSIYSAAETLNTLKFAQRAKLIQNNAVVNEDSSGDVTALQQQIRILKEELLVLKRQNVSRSLTFGSTVVGDARQEHVSASNVNASGNVMHDTDDMLVSESKSSLRVSSKQLKCLETTLAGALRRERMAETSIKQLEAEIEQLNRLVRQREEDSRCTKMMLKFREDKVQRMEALLGGLMPADTYLVEENNALCEEIQQLRTKVDKNPEVTRFALENIRLLEQLRRFQDFYEEGERDMLVSEVSELRDQLLLFVDGNSKQQNHPNINLPSKEADCINQENASLHLELKKTLHELEECRNNLNSCVEDNTKLVREINDLRAPLRHLKSETHDNHGSTEVIKESTLEAPSVDEQLSNPVQQKNEEMLEALMNHAQEIMDLQLELDIFKIILKEERSSRRDLEDKEVCLIKDLQMAERKALLLTKQYEDVKEELKKAKSIVEALENQQLLSISEIEDLRNSSTHYADLVHKLEHEISILKQQASGEESKDIASSRIPKREDSPLQVKLNKMHTSLDKAKRLNMCYQRDLASHASIEEEMDEVRRQVEAETAEVIVCLQEELGNLQQQVLDNNLKEELAEGRLVHLHTELKKLQENNEVVAQEKESLCKKLADKDKQLKTLTEEWESMTSEIETALAGGHEALTDASDQLESICGSFPLRRTWISEQLGRLTRNVSDKELLIEELNRSMEDANTRKNDLERMLRSLRGATLAITEEHQKDCTEKEKEIILLTSQLGDKMLTIEELESKVKHGEEELRKASRCATAAFVIVSRLSAINSDYLDALEHKDFLIIKCKGIHMQKDALLHSRASAVDEGEKKISSLKLELEEAKEGCSILRVQLSEEKMRVIDLEEKLKEAEDNNIVETRERLTELKEGISALESCLTVAGKVANPEKENAAGYPVHVLYDNKSEEWTGTRENQGFKNLETLSVPTIETDIPECDSVVGNSFNKYSNDQKSLACRRTVTNSTGDVTVALLKDEIESAFDSLKRVQVEMAKLCKENKEVCDSERRTQWGTDVIMSQVLALRTGMSNFENQFCPKLLSLDQKLQMAESATQDIITSWRLKNESFEHELGDSKMLVVQNSAEASCILAKFKEAQDTITEADFMVNELMIANESKKNEIDRMKKEKIILLNERDSLIGEVQRLQSSNNQKDLSYAKLEKQAESDFIAIKGYLQELEGIVSQAQTSFDEFLLSISSDFLCLKSQLVDSTKLVLSWVEEIWSEIILKDCSMSVLHLCHMGIMLETVTGLNVENGLLHRGLCQSNSLLVDLREHNSKSKRELQMCRVLEGKLLADIKNNFDRISRKEDETGKLTRKLTSFEKKILDLQKQEEIMLQRSNYMGSELATLMSELDSSNRNVLASLLYQERLVKDKEDVLQYQEEKSFVDLLEKDFYLLVLASELKLLAAKKAEMENEQTGYVIALDGLKNDIVLLHLDSELKELILFDNDVKVTHLANEIEVIRRERNDLLSEISGVKLENLKLKEANNGFEQEMKLIGAVSNSNDALRNELVELTDAKIRLSFQFQELQSEYEKSLEELKMKERSLEISSSRISILDQQNQVLQQEFSLLETSVCNLRNDLNSKSEELATMRCLEEEMKSWKSEATKSKIEHCCVLQEVEEKKSEIESFIRCKEIADNENRRLRAEIVSLENSVSTLQTDLDKVKVELNQCRVSESAVEDVLRSKTSELQVYFAEVDSLKKENIFLTSELASQEENNCKSFKTLSSNLKKYIESVDIVNTRCISVFEVLNTGFSELEKKFEEIQQEVNWASNFLEEFEAVETYCKELIAENCYLKAELGRKDNVLEGLVFDLKLLQESASSNKDQKDEFEKLLASFEGLETELDEAVEKVQILEGEVQEKTDIISTLELDVSGEHESVKSLSSTNLELTTKLANALEEKEFTEKKLVQRGKDNQKLKSELLQLHTALEQMDEFTESLKINLQTVTCEKDAFHAELLMLKQEFQMAQNLAEENEAVAIETRQVAETRKLYLDEKEAEVRLLERSVEELERTVNVLESKVDIVKGEAELQRMQREDLEIELQAIKQKMQAVESGNDEMKRGLDDKEKSLQEALQRIKILEREIAAKDTEISKCQTHISELNLHAEAQAFEYKQKFKALEVMAEQVKMEGPTTHPTSSSTNKLEKCSSRPRGSGSPFKCIGLGFVQQLKSEREDDELTSGRLRIEELEALAAHRQKEIFMLNARLATAESMTHDVLRDLLGLKSDMTGYATLMDNQQVPNMTEKAQLYNADVLVKDQEVINLKKQLSEFVEERKGWLEEIDRKQAEIVVTQIALMELRQHHQLLTAEHDIFKMENVNHKKKVAELELEVKKLSGQQNIQQRIHHHAKIKEENNFLKAQNEELSSKLRRSEAVVSRVKEELSRFRAANGRNPCIHIDEEQRLKEKLKETEEERLRLAQKLLGLCTSILKAAGITRPASDINLPMAEEALEQLKDRSNILNRELQELKLKSRVNNERNRLSELMPQLQSSPLSSRSEGSRQSTPNTASQHLFFTCLDR